MKVKTRHKSQGVGKINQRVDSREIVIHISSGGGNCGSSSNNNNNNT